MQVRKGAFVLLLVTTVIISACGASRPTPEAAMDKETPTAEAMMETESPTAEPMMGEETPTLEPMMGEEMSPTEAMTGTESATAEPMMGDETPTLEPMMGEEMSPTEAMTGTEAAAAEPMMGEETPTAEPMMGEEMSPTEAMTGSATAEPMMGQETPTPEAMMGTDWFNAELTDVNTGKSFKVADFHGKVVLVETLAVWCPTCFTQEKEVQALHELLGMRDDLVSLGLDIDPNETADILKAYTNKNGFDWLYAVAPADVAREIGHLYGDQFLNPPSTPMLIIDRQGQVHPLPFGVKSAQALQEALGLYLNP
jgi:peroxiredoxin